tara:strand:+ start:8080 stop:8334 length:255 start_codon:yes stop_codon:yes gene_type:complete
MINKETLIKKIIYRSNHRGTKEMDLLLGSFVKKYIYNLNLNELNELSDLLSLDDEILFEWYFNKLKNVAIRKNKISDLLKNHKV